MIGQHVMDDEGFEEAQEHVGLGFGLENEAIRRVAGRRAAMGSHGSLFRSRKKKQDARYRARPMRSTGRRIRSIAAPARRFLLSEKDMAAN
ncbi:MAG: hypothetical protein B7Y95_15660 [Rhizobiales bacterium 32-66-11]|nr:MAG: hypothetical protein B7Y95_15660 [Rhizobiales bacterium 32-66-11]